MASEFSHAIVALAMGKAFQNKVLSWRELVLGAFGSVVPDLDVMGF
ncbi:MAG: metal-dependent hydrolase, partial [Nitrospiraceae bacterium]